MSGGSLSVSVLPFRRRACIILVALGLVGITPAHAAKEVLSKRRVDEYGAVSGAKGGNKYLAWTQSPVGKLRRAKVMARRNGNRFRVSPRGTRAYTGGISGNILIYQQVRNGRSDVMGFNLNTKRRFKYRGPSTRKWEMRPTISGRWILFTRETRRRQSILLYNTKTKNSRKLLSVRRRNGRRRLLSGQVNGRWAVYQRCSRKACNVFRYNIRTRDRMRIPRRRKVQYAPSVSRDGDVYFMGSGIGCGTRVEVLRRRNGNTTRIAKVGNKDTLSTYAGPAPGSRSDVFFDKVRCHEGIAAKRLRADVYKVRVQ